MASRAFRGEIWTNVHPYILDAIVKANAEEVDGCAGGDKYTAKATELLAREFDGKISVFYTISGTAANVLALKCMLSAYSTVLCATQTHINCYECGATEYNLGAKILAIDSPDGKLTPALLDTLTARNAKYHYRHTTVVITQPTEFGTVYTSEEIKAVCDWAHEKNMSVLVDGARIGSAVAATGESLKEMIEKPGVDALTFGGTKAGAMMGEAVILFRPEFAVNLDYIQKQSMQHFDKSKFIGAQMTAILENKLWITNAAAANEKAKRLAKVLSAKGVKFAYPVKSNMVFAILDENTLARVNEKYDLHYWNAREHSVRIALTYATEDEDIDALVKLI